jgi:hypothetical protein
MGTSESELLKLVVMGTKLDPIVSVIGPLNGETPISLADAAGTETIIFDLEHLTRVNSLGVRQWSTFMSGFRKSNPESVIFLKNCPRFFIETMNMIYDFVPGPFAVESFRMPFYCEECDESVECVAVRGDHYHEMQEPCDKVDVGEVLCPKCNASMEPDFVNTSYFKFLPKSKQSLGRLISNPKQQPT